MTSYRDQDSPVDRGSTPTAAGPWKGIDDVEIAVAEYLDWFNQRRLPGEIGMAPGVEYGRRYLGPLHDWILTAKPQS